MKSMTKQERLDDICGICGLSEDLVRRVQQAETISIIKSLKRGERATLHGRCSYTPQMRNKVHIGGRIAKSMSVRVQAAPSLLSEIENIEDYEVSSIQEPETGIRLNQISSLA